MSTTKQTIEKIQTILKSAGLYTHDIDGIAGEKTLVAVQSAISATCQPDAPTVDAPVIAVPTPTPPTVTPPAKPKGGDISANFNLSELVHSNSAVIYKLNNTPSAAHKQNLIEATINLFQPIRDILGQPMDISSGYRSKAVNAKVGGSASSAHSIGFAIDFKSDKFGSSTDIVKHLAKELKARNIKFDQMILEFPNAEKTWVHIGYKNGAGKQRGEIKTAKRGRDGKAVYTLGIHA